MKQAKLKRIAAAGVAAAALAFAPGCATVEYSSPTALKGVTIRGVDGQVKEHVLIDTTGYFLFNTLPLLTGDVTWDARKRSISGGTSFFSNHVKASELQNVLVNLAKSRNCDLADVSYYSDGETFADNNNAFLGVLIGKTHMGVSATFVPRK